jgi:hypothetical protein
VKTKERKINKINHHEILQEWTMSFHPIDYSIFMATQPLTSRKKSDNQAALWDPLYYIRENGIDYTFIRNTTKKIFLLKGKEIVFLNACKKLDNGDFLEVYVSYDDREWPRCREWDRVTVKGGVLYRKVDGGYGGSVSQEDQWLGNSGWRVSNWSLVDPQTRMPLKLLKKPLANFYNGYFRNFFGELERELAGNGGDMKRNLRAIPQ